MVCRQRIEGHAECVTCQSVSRARDKFRFPLFFTLERELVQQRYMLLHSDLQATSLYIYLESPHVLACDMHTRHFSLAGCECSIKYTQLISIAVTLRKNGNIRRSSDRMEDNQTACERYGVNTTSALMWLEHMQSFIHYSFSSPRKISLERVGIILSRQYYISHLIALCR